MKKVIPIFGTLLLGLVIGGGYAIYSLKSDAVNLPIKNGCWIVNPKMDLSNRHQRARVAVAGLFALRESEVLYFVASQDNEGRPLSSTHEYVLEGPSPDARYWSYTLYDGDFFLIDNPDNIYGYNMDNIQYIDEPVEVELPSNTSGNHQITLSKKPSDNNWLPTGNANQLYITLRMYNPSPEVYNNLEDVVLPTIRRIDE